MKRHILTGAPGAGKTTLINALKNLGHVTVGEAATDVIAEEQAGGNAEPWTKPDFIEKICALQKRRVIETAGALQFHDRSPVCTYALALYLGYPPPAMLLDEIDRMAREKTYEKTIFFIANLGFVTPTAARKISFEDSLAFEKVHLDAYDSFGYTCLKIEAKPLSERIDDILRHGQSAA